jgi:hypothetical protein
MFSAVIIGGLLPIALPLILLGLGSLTSRAQIRLIGWAAGQAEVIGALIGPGAD